MYSSPVAISANSTLQAIAYETGYTNSAVASGNYHHPVCRADLQPDGGHFHYVGIHHHLHQHRWRDDPLYH